jgi:hypothetical protein
MQVEPDKAEWNGENDLGQRPIGSNLVLLRCRAVRAEEFE